MQLASIFGGKALSDIMKGDSAANAEKAKYAAMYPATQGGIGAQANQNAQDLFNIAKPGYQAASDYYTKLLSGDPSVLTAAASPEINATNDQFNAVRKNLINNSYSRSGGLDQGLANVEAGRARTISDIFGNVRPLAAQGLTNLASQTGQQSTNDFNSSLMALYQQQQNQFQQQQLSNQTWQNTGSFLTNMLLGKNSGGLFGEGGLLGALKKVPAAVQKPYFSWGINN